MRQAVQDSVPAGTEELNLRAFDAGWEAFENEYGEQKKVAKKKPAKKKAPPKQAEA
jgi:Pyruvate/2-oxoacid:ferredoxin oxidoreductase gamma subunit